MSVVENFGVALERIYDISSREFVDYNEIILAIDEIQEISAEALEIEGE